MTVVLHVEPDVPPMSWEDFCCQKPPFSIALDGYVGDAPKFDEDGPYLNLNHHEQVDRLATRATCAQVLMALRQGLIERFRDDLGFRAEVYVNDCDEDVCVSWYLLKHGYACEDAFNPTLNRLVAIEDALDATAGAYPFPKDSVMLEELAWVFDPYRQFRSSGQLDNREPGAFLNVIVEVEERIRKHLIGEGDSIELDTRYRQIGGDGKWALIEDIGAQARTGVFADGIRAYVSVRERPDGRWTYTIGRMSPFIPFDVPCLLEALDAVEGLRDEHWGGGTTIGGSPRIHGSRLSPIEVEKIIESTLNNGRATKDCKDDSEDECQ